MSKVAGLISKGALAEIFARASEIKDQEGERQPGRLGRAMLDELLARARQVRAADAAEAKEAEPAPSEGGDVVAAWASGEFDIPDPVEPPPLRKSKPEEEEAEAPEREEAESEEAQSEEAGSEEGPRRPEQAAPPPPSLPRASSAQIAAADALSPTFDGPNWIDATAPDDDTRTERLDRFDLPADAPFPSERAPIAEDFTPTAPLRGKIDLSSSSDELGVLPEAPPTESQPLASSAPSLHQLGAFLNESSEDFLNSTMLEDLELPEAREHGIGAALSAANEISFEGDEDELARLLEESYRHYQRGVGRKVFLPRRSPPPPPQPKASQTLSLGGGPDGAPPTLSLGGPKPKPPAKPAAPEVDPFSLDPWTGLPPEQAGGAQGGVAGPAHQDPFANDPFERAPSAHQVRREFEGRLLTQGMGGMLERRQVPAGQPQAVPVRLLYDQARQLFGASLEHRFLPGDRFQLRDGRIFRIAASELVYVGQQPAFQEIVAIHLGALNSPLHESWEGQFPL